MRNLQQFLADYGESHQNPVNQWVHFFCVPAIFFSTLGLLWLVPIGQWLGLEGGAARWVNGATVLGALSAIVYLRLSFGVFLLMVAWFAASVAGILAIQSAGWSLFWISLVVWVVAWAVQVWGHKVEGKKPSFVEDLVFLLIGPIFVCVEIAARLGLRVPYALHR
ncbi:Mpo1 family 2-hydroxy fatty acid dioxygenase [Alcanivorax quisquiliarum]|uniref:DUF962 domain-containing protein n=1 Tax=Alcanivorax quisquiliarum TaxID=2933565 RepID=A0ABT0E4W2_9GAMM|nr:Mpo1-like protein [Alcanivorax quisquiliarum]MCK0536729.1 DUF962 domain-containing protein [Alcanivorax quisquiliarum]